jgi:hypothetical protein
MLVIRSQQMQAFRAVERRRLEERVVGHLRARFPQRCHKLQSERLRAEAARGIDAARRHGVTTVESIAFLCGWFFELGERFQRSPAGDEALAILESPEYPGQIKVLLVAECLEAVSRGRTLVTADDDDA